MDAVADASKLQPVALRKTTALINHFIVSTTKFLNHFSSIAEEKLEKLSQSVERVEVELDILEAKLEKIEDPTGGIYNTPEPAPAAAPPPSQSAAPPPQAGGPPPPPGGGPPPPPGGGPPPPPGPPGPPGPPPPPGAGPPPPGPAAAMTFRQDPKYSKFFELLAQGMSREEVAFKMTTQGLNPVVLSTPDAPSSTPPPPAPAAVAPPPAPAAPAAPVMTCENDPLYSKYFKMLKMGVHPQAIKGKMSADGIDPNIIDTPEAPSPNTSAMVIVPGGDID